MNVTKAERKESTKHCCGNGCRRRDSAEHKEEGGALIGQRITENNVTNADRNVNSLLERIVSPENLNQAYKRVMKNKGAGGVDGMKVGELLQYLKGNGGEEWMRRRIRMVFWKRWKRVRTRYRNLEKLGISHSNAGILANSRKGYWLIAGSPILNTALSNERLERNGFQYFFSYYKSVTA